MSDPLTLYPTHSCFDDSGDTFAALVHQAQSYGDTGDRFRLVHAICLAPDGDQYSHGWVEDLDEKVAVWVAFQNGERRHFGSPIDEYRQIHNVQESVSYMWAEALALNVQHDHLGPWIEKYRALCGGSKEWAVVEIEPSNT